MAKRRTTKAQMRAHAMAVAAEHAGHSATLRAALKDARGHKARKKRRKGKSKGGHIPMEFLIKRYDRLGRLLKRRGFKE